MYYFKNNFLEFYKDLAANNHKIWFDENRKKYEIDVKRPFAIFIQELIEELIKLNIEITPLAKDCIFRINRDIRFSKDKTPYKLFASALLSPTGRKDMENPGFYLELNPEKMSIYGGMYMPNTAQVLKIRTFIANNNLKFEGIINETNFLEKFGKINGDKQIRLSKEFKLIAEQQPLLYNKQWYIEAQLNPEIIISENLMKTVLDHIKTALPLHNFINNALE